MLKRHSHGTTLSYLTLLLMIFGATLTARAQYRIAPVESIGETITCRVGGKTYTLKPNQSLIVPKPFTGKNQEAQEIFDKVTLYTELRNNIYTVPVVDDTNVEICPGSTDYIAYNAGWLVAIYKETNSKWTLYAIIAHEIGHYVFSHDRTTGGCAPHAELQADEYAGEVLAKMGGSLPEAQTAFNSKRMREHKPRCHPPIDDRLAAVKKGWEKVRKGGSGASGSSTSTAKAERSNVETMKISRTGYIKGLNGRLNPILDSSNRTYLYADNIAIEGGKNQPVKFTPGEPFVVEDSLGNQVELNVVSITADSSTIEYRRLMSATDKRTTDLSLKVVDRSSRPIRGAEVLAIFSDGTHLKGATDSQGNARIQKLKDQTVRIYCAHPNYAAFYKENYEVGSGLVIQLEAEPRKGSIVIDSTGYIPGLEGRLNPKLDTSNRMYLYADGISIENGKKQPVDFRLDQPLKLEDSKGKRFELKVVAMVAAISLIEFTRLD